MIAQGIAIWVHYKVWDSANKVFLSGDIANHTLQVIKDGVLAAATNTPQAVGGILYRVLLTASEVNGLFITLGGVTSTADAYIIPVHMLTDATTKGVSLTVQYTAWNMDTDAPELNDQANHTLNVAEANATAAAINSPTQVSAVLIPGVYSLVLESIETDGPIDSVYGTSTTSNVTLMPITFPVALAADPAAESDVRLGTDYDSGALTGSAAIPGPSDVRAGVAVDDTVGNYVPADEDNHALGDSYGSLGTEFTGTKALTSFQLPVDVILEDEEILVFEGCE